MQILCRADVAYCEKKKKEIPEHLAKTTNYCPFYNLNSIDAFGENEKGYQPRNKRQEIQQCDGQLSLEDLCKEKKEEDGKTD